MKHIFFISLLFFVLGLISPNAQPHEQTEGFLIMFEPHVKADDVRSKNLFSIDGDLEIVEYFENVNIWWVKHNPQKITRESALQRLRAEPGIRYADPIRNRVTWRGTVPNDTHFSDQWGMRNNGQTGGTAGADISATKAWDITRGDSWGAHVPVVAVIDNGFEQDHPDLAFLTGGYNAYNDNFNVPVADHGTHVTGILGATSNNSSGVAGVMWNTEVFPVAGSSINETVVVRAYDYILGLRQDYNNSGGSSGRFIVATNSSFGINEGDPSDYGCWCAMYDAMGAVGIISVAATANRDWDIDQVGDVPTACNSNYLITVTNTTHLDNKYAHPDLDKGAAWGLNTIHLGAPGTNIKSTLTLASGSYGYDTGTSMATPHVTGVVGLIYSVLSSADIANSLTNPGSLALSVKDYILNNVDPIADLSGITTTGGRLNAYEAVKHALPNQLNSPFFAVWPSQDIGGSHIFGDSYLEFGTLIIPQGKAAVFSGTLTGFGGDYARILVQGNMVVESGTQLLDLSIEVAPTGRLIVRDGATIRPGSLGELLVEGYARLGSDVVVRRGDIEVGAGGELVVGAGSELYFTTGKGLTAWGRVALNGYNGKPVVMNIDPALSGTWAGVHLHGAGSELAYVHITGAVNGVSAYNTGNISLNSVQVYGSSFDGFRLVNAAADTWNIRADGNLRHGILYDGAANGGVSTSILKGNEYTGIKLEGGAVVWQAQNSRIYDGLTNGIRADDGSYIAVILPSNLKII
jgi:hypothetical protein